MLLELDHQTWETEAMDRKQGATLSGTPQPASKCKDLTEFKKRKKSEYRARDVSSSGLQFPVVIVSSDCKQESALQGNFELNDRAKMRK